jgi:hypothetical protein
MYFIAVPVFSLTLTMARVVRDESTYDTHMTWRVDVTAWQEPLKRRKSVNVYGGDLMNTRLRVSTR